MTIKPENLVAIEKVMNVELDFLGSLLWYSVTDCRIDRDQLQQVFAEVGIDEKHLPKPINTRDAFRRATKAGEIKKEALDDERYLNVLIRESKVTNKMIVRHLVREVVDAENKRLEYAPVCELVFSEDAIHVIPKHEMNKIERAAVDKIKEAYQVERNNYNGRTMRDVITDVLDGCDPVNVRPSGGVYFVAKQHEATLTNLQRFANRISDFSTTGHKTTFWMVPVVNAEEQKKMIEISLEEQVKSESKALIEEMSKLLKSDRKITQGLAKQYVDRAKDLAKMVKRYEDLLDTQNITATSNLELTMAAAMQMLEKVEVA